LKTTAWPRVVAVAVRSPSGFLSTVRPRAFTLAFSAENSGAEFLRSVAAPSAASCSAPARPGFASWTVCSRASWIGLLLTLKVTCPSSKSPAGCVKFALAVTYDDPRSTRKFGTSTTVLEYEMLVCKRSNGSLYADPLTIVTARMARGSCKVPETVPEAESVPVTGRSCCPATRSTWSIGRLRISAFAVVS
jgi:hypothetical protein